MADPPEPSRRRPGGGALLARLANKRARVDSTVPDLDDLPGPGAQESEMTVYYATAGGRRTQRTTMGYVEPEPAPPLPSQGPETAPEPSASSYTAIDDGGEVFLDLEDDLGEAPDALRSDSKGSKGSKRQSRANAALLAFWLLHRRDQYLQELLRRDGWGDGFAGMACVECGTSTAEFWCEDCFGGRLLCCQCTQHAHLHLPFHRVKRWNGQFFAPMELHQLGLRVSLGHMGRQCQFAHSDSWPISVADVTGTHSIRVNYCGCTGFAEKHVQLLRAGLFPASEKRPKTAFTLDYLDTFHKMTLQGKTPIYDWYIAISRKSNELADVGSRAMWSQVSRVTRMYRHLLMLKRGGRGHDPLGAAGTKNGELALLCPACPQPSYNLPNGWEKATSATAYLYKLRVAVDACFKLKLKNRGLHDPELGSGMAYFVPETTFREYIALNGKQENEASTCSSVHNAVAQAMTKGSSSYIVTGVVAAKCSRHVFILPNGVADLDRGEGYVYTDEVIVSSLEYLLKDLTAELRVFFGVDLSYDIVCSFWKNFKARILKNFSKDSRECVLPLCWRFFIPKFHISAHGSGCQTVYSLNWTCGCGRTHGETVEQEWAHINKCATATREQGPGARHATLDDQWHGWNWRQTAGMGKFLHDGLLAASKWKDKMRQAAGQYTASVGEDVAKIWQADVDLWDLDHSNPDPYAEQERVRLYVDVRQRLLEEEVLSPDEPLHSMGPSEFVRRGIDLEGRQRTLQLAVSCLVSATATALREAGISDKRASLKRELDAYFAIRAVYIPCAARLEELDEQSHQVVVPPERRKLWLPNQIKGALREEGCLRGVAQAERQLREAEAEDALKELRRLRRVLAGLHHHFNKHISGSGQGVTTRGRAIVKSAENRIKRQVLTYRAAWNALGALDPGGSWLIRLQKLNDKDNAGPRYELDEVQKEKFDASNKRKGIDTQGRYDPTWIWKVPRIVPALGSGDHSDVSGDTTSTLGDCSKAEFQAEVRTEWAKSQARALRWEEEKELLVEEMRRTLVFVEKKAIWWEAHAANYDAKLASGLSAYAFKQANLWHTLASSFANRWAAPLTAAGVKEDWWMKFVSPPGSSRLSAAPGASSASTSFAAPPAVSPLGSSPADANAGLRTTFPPVSPISGGLLSEPFVLQQGHTRPGHLSHAYSPPRLPAPILHTPETLIQPRPPFTPNATTPNMFMPNASVFGANTLVPNVFTPNVLTPNVFTPNMFAANTLHSGVLDPDLEPLSPSQLGFGAVGSSWHTPSRFDREPLFPDGFSAMDLTDDTTFNFASGLDQLHPIAGPSAIPFPSTPKQPQQASQPLMNVTPPPEFVTQAEMAEEEDIEDMEELGKNDEADEGDEVDEDLAAGLEWDD